MFDKSKSEPDTNRSLGAFLVLLSIVALLLAVACLVVGIRDFVAAFENRNFFYRPMWLMALLSLLFLMLAAGSLRARERRRSCRLPAGRFGNGGAAAAGLHPDRLASGTIHRAAAPSRLPENAPSALCGELR